MSNQSRQSAEELVKRLQNDPAFKEQITADPMGTFQAEGLPAAAVDDFMREGLITPDVQGYSEPIEDGCTGTCWWTCVKTCSTTNSEIT